MVGESIILPGAAKPEYAYAHRGSFPLAAQGAQTLPPQARGRGAGPKAPGKGVFELDYLGLMPVMVVGADTTQGGEITQRLLDPDREVRVFVTDPEVAEEWRRSGAKVALGDVSDDSHVAAACLNCFSVVLVAHAARDQRLRSFADSDDAVFRGWARAVSTAGVQRVIWVLESEPPEVTGPEVAVVDPGMPDIAGRVFRLDEAATL